MLHQRLSQITEAYPSKAAIVCGDQVITYSELYTNIVGLSIGMHSLDIQPSDMVMLLLPNCIEFVLSLFALAFLHAIVLPLNPLLKEEEVKQFLQEKRIKVIITDRRHSIYCRVIVKSLGLTTEIIVIDDFNGSEKSFQSLLLQGHSSENLPQLAEIYAGDVLYHYSSGSTGQPKRLYRTQKQLFHEAYNFTQTANITHEDVILCVVPLFHAHGLGNALLAALFSGATLVILESLTQDSPFVEVPFAARCPRVFELIAREKVTVFPGVSYIFDALATDMYAPQVDMSSLRLCFSAGNSLPHTVFQHFFHRFGIPVRQLYGCTEAGSISINLAQTDEFIFDSVGKPIMGVDIIIVDEDMKVVTAGSIGEIAIKSLALTAGYEHLSDLNDKAFKEGYFLTGDLGRQDEAGYLFITGRKRIFIDTGGYKVDPCEVENVISMHPAVAEVAVVGVPISPGEELVKAVIVPKGVFKKQEIFQWCRDKIADFKVPSIIEVRTELPRNAVGKILIKDLREGLKQWNDEEGLVSREYLLLSTPKQREVFLQEYLKKLCTHVFSLSDTSSIGLQHPFGDFGITSIKALELKNCLDVDLGLSLPATLVWHYPTIAELTLYLMERLAMNDVSSGAGFFQVADKQESAQTLEDFSAIEKLSDEEAKQFLEKFLAEEVKKDE